MGTGALTGRFALPDDVITTGVTVETLARVLKDAGAARVSVWSVARFSDGTLTAIHIG